MESWIVLIRVINVSTTGVFIFFIFLRNCVPLSLKNGDKSCNSFTDCVVVNVLNVVYIFYTVKLISYTENFKEHWKFKVLSTLTSKISNFQLEWKHEVGRRKIKDMRETPGGPIKPNREKDAKCVTKYLSILSVSSFMITGCSEDKIVSLLPQ
jgi:hypothetical protein